MILYCNLKNIYLFYIHNEITSKRNQMFNYIFPLILLCSSATWNLKSSLVILQLFLHFGRWKQLRSRHIRIHPIQMSLEVLAATAGALLLTNPRKLSLDRDMLLNSSETAILKHTNINKLKPNQKNKDHNSWCLHFRSIFNRCPGPIVIVCKLLEWHMYHQK